MPDLDQLSVADIEARLLSQGVATFDVPPSMQAKNTREAAVLIPFLRIDDSWHILYIRRTTFDGDRHSGQVAFAGGKRDPDDASLLITALREADEEVGIAANDVHIVGRINHHHTISDFQVRPYVGIIPWPYPIKADELEVARIFTIPLKWLASADNYRTEQRLHPESSRPWPIIYYDLYDGEMLWGATARMTRSMIDILSTASQAG